MFFLNVFLSCILLYYIKIIPLLLLFSAYLNNKYLTCFYIINGPAAVRTVRLTSLWHRVDCSTITSIYVKDQVAEISKIILK